MLLGFVSPKVTKKNAARKGRRLRWLILWWLKAVKTVVSVDPRIIHLKSMRYVCGKIIPHYFAPFCGRLPAEGYGRASLGGIE